MKSTTARPSDIPSSLPKSITAKGEPGLEPDALQLSPPGEAATDFPDVPSPSPASKQGKSWKRWIWIAGAIALLSVGATFGWRWWQFQQRYATTDNATIKGHLSPIAAQIPATVEQVLVKNGATVQAGQTLLILADPDLALKLRQAQADLAVAQAKLKSAQDKVTITRQTNPTQEQQSQANLSAKQSAIQAAQAQLKEARAGVTAQQAKVTQAQAEVAQTKADFQRYQSLYRSGAVSAQQFDNAKAANLTAQAQVSAAQQAVAQAQAAVQTAQAQLQQAQANADAAQGQVQETEVSSQNVVVQQDDQQQAAAEVAQAQASLDLAKQQLIYTTIQAPVSGTVGQVTAQVGQKVQVGQPLLSVVPLQTDAIYVEANFKETDLQRLRLGETATVELDAYPGEDFPASIVGLSPATGSSFALLPPDNATGNFNKVVQWVPVQLAFQPGLNAESKLRPGLSAEVTVDTQSSAAAATSPAIAPVTAPIASPEL